MANNDDVERIRNMTSQEIIDRVFEAAKPRRVIDSIAGANLTPSLEQTVVAGRPDVYLGVTHTMATSERAGYRLDPQKDQPKDYHDNKNYR